MTELRNYVRQYIKIKEHGISTTFKILEVMSCLRKRTALTSGTLPIRPAGKSSTTYLVDNLVKRHLVKRVEDENDRRNKLIYLTPKGIRLGETTTTLVAEVYAIASEAPLQLIFRIA